jgi:hypothetical protein
MASTVVAFRVAPLSQGGADDPTNASINIEISSFYPQSVSILGHAIDTADGLDSWHLCRLNRPLR